MKKRFSEEQIIGFLREAEAGLPVKVNRPGFTRHLQAVHYGNQGGV